MTEDSQQANTQSEENESELESLKARAEMMGIKHHPNIGVDKLREKVKAAQEGNLSADDAEEPTPTEQNTAEVAKPSPAESQAMKRKYKRDEANRLVRIRVSCMNPNKREWDGEIFTTGNAVVGSFKKYVPFGVEWHVPAIIHKMISNRECQVFHTVTDAKGNKVKRGKLIKEFAVEVLQPLTPDEMQSLAQRQAMAAGSSDS